VKDGLFYGASPQTPVTLEDQKVFDARKMFIVIRSRRSLSISLTAKKGNPKKAAPTKNCLTVCSVVFGKFQELASGSDSLKFLTLSLGRKPTIFEGDSR